MKGIGLLTVILILTGLLSAEDRTIWKTKTDGEIIASPLIYENRLYIGSCDSCLYKFDSNIGNLVWKIKLDGEIRSKAVLDIWDNGSEYYDGGNVIITTLSGRYYSIKRTDGSIVWSGKIASPISATPVFWWNNGMGAMMNMVDEGGIFYLIDADDGSIQWSKRFSTSPIQSSICFVNYYNMYFGCNDNKVFKTDCFTANASDYTTGGAISYSSPLHFNGSIFIGSNDYCVYSLSYDLSSLNWKYSTGDMVISSPSVNPYENTLYVGSYDTYLYAFNAYDGVLKWKCKTGGKIEAAPNYNPSIDRVYIGSKDGYFYAVNASNGSIVWTYKTDGEIISTVSSFMCKAYVGSKDGYIYCISNDERNGFNRNEKVYELPVLTFRAYPNPFANRISISLPVSGVIYTITGQSIKVLTKGRHELDTSKWKSGIYIIKCEKEAKRIIRIDN